MPPLPSESARYRLKHQPATPRPLTRSQVTHLYLQWYGITIDKHDQVSFDVVADQVVAYSHEVNLQRHEVITLMDYLLNEAWS